MGVPVIASRNGASRSRATWCTLDALFLRNCASSSTTPPQLTPLYPAASIRSSV